MSTFNRIHAGAVVAVSVLLAGCPVTDNPPDAGPAVVGSGFTCSGRAPAGLPVEATALTATNQLVRFNTRTLAQVGSNLAITGLQAGESVVGIDFRPQDGALVAVAKAGTVGNIYTVNTTTGAATLLTGAALALTGTSFGVDFNPAANRLRIVSDAEENLRLDLTVSPYTVTADTVLAPAGSNVAAAYTNNYHQSAVTTLYNIDSAGQLKLQGSVDGTTSPNTGATTVVGPLGTGPISGEAGFDIDGVSGVGLAAISQAGATSSSIFAINLATGAATCYGTGTIPGGAVVRDLALATPQPAVAFGVTPTNDLVSFTPSATGIATVTTIAAITGVQAGEQILGLDVRPNDGALYGVGSTSRLYTIDRATAVATLVGSGAFTPAFTGTAFGFDFNPAVDRIRALTDVEENFRLVPAVTATATLIPGTVVDFDAATAGTQYDANLNIVSAGAVVAAAEVTGGAYTNNFHAPAPAVAADPAGHPGTTLFVVDSSTNNLLRQGAIGGGTAACTATTSRDANPNCGDLVAIGALGVDPDSTNLGMDIVGGTAVRANGANIGDTVTYAVMTVGGSPNLYRINLGSGAATQIGTTAIGGGAPVTLRAFAVRVVR